MSEWKEYKLGDVLNVKHGFAFKGEFFSQVPTKDVLLSPGNFNIGGGFKSDKFKFYNGNYPESYILKEDDVIVTMTDLSKEGDTLGYSAKIPSHQGIRYLHNQRLGLVELKDKSVNLNFIYWLLRTRKYQQFIVSSATGTTVKHTSPTRIGEYSFFAPDLPTQTAIAEILSSLDDKIELNNNINKELEKLAQTLFKQWFIEFEFPDENGEPYQSSGGEMIESELGMIPKDWEIGILDDILEVKGGTTPSTKDASFWDGIYHWTSPRDLSNLEFPLLIDTDKKITAKGLKKISSGLLPKGTLLLSSRAPIGYLAITEIETAINQGYIAINGKKEFSNIFILYWLKVNMHLVIERANGSTFLEISKTNFKQINCIIPDSTILHQYINQANATFEVMRNNLLENQELSTLRDTLLPKLISGELNVKDL